MRHPAKDIDLILDVIRTARMLRHSVATEVADRLAMYRSRLRENRKWLRLNEYSRPAHAEFRTKDCQRMLRNAKRLRQLSKRFASFRGEHPDARLPIFKERRGG